MTDKQVKSNLEKLARSKRKLRVIDLLNMSNANSVLEKVWGLPNLEKVIVIAQTADGTEVFHNCADDRRVILELDIMHHQLINDFLYDDEELEV